MLNQGVMKLSCLQTSATPASDDYAPIPYITALGAGTRGKNSFNLLILNLP